MPKNHTPACHCSVCYHPAKSIEERFWSKVDKSGGPLACWLWTGATVVGYGTLFRGGYGIHMILAHRLSWEIANGKPVPDGLFIMHECDNRPRVNPAHLLPGTLRQNMEHMVAVGRSAKGEQQGGSKLTEENVRDIRAMYAAGNGSQSTLAVMFGVSQTLIGMIVRRKYWRHLT